MPRTLDLDIIYYGSLIYEFDEWRIPDPDAMIAPHIAIPVAEIAPTFKHPENNFTAEFLAKKLIKNEKEVELTMGVREDSLKLYSSDENFDANESPYSSRLQELVRDQLEELGEDVNREGLLKTPLRVAKALDYLTSGYEKTVEEVINNAVFDSAGAEGMITVKHIEFYSMCEHHMLPFFGHISVAYLPKEKIIGLSKIARISEIFSRRLQVQERLTNQIANAIEKALDPYGVAVIIEGKHLCMMMRGVQKQESSMTTSAMRGTFQNNARTRSEFLDLIRR
tara:strand:- start:36 stop:878 length:843 start_codon:yes stop_codon:yes gene_type:complete